MVTSFARLTYHAVYCMVSVSGRFQQMEPHETFKPLGVECGDNSAAFASTNVSDAYRCSQAVIDAILVLDFPFEFRNCKLQEPNFMVIIFNTVRM